jgi:hypothetical protein
MEQVSIKGNGLLTPPLLWRHIHVTTDVTLKPPTPLLIYLIRTKIILIDLIGIEIKLNCSNWLI